MLIANPVFNSADAKLDSDILATVLIQNLRQMVMRGPDNSEGALLPPCVGGIVQPVS